jgi:hypothetical protein
MPRPIDGLSLWDLRRGRKSGLKHSFWSNVGAIDAGDCAAVVLLIGTDDCEWAIPRLVKRLRFRGWSGSRPLETDSVRILSH